MPFWLSFWHPAIVAYLIITFDIYWFYKSITLAYYAVKSYVTLVAHSKIDWLEIARKNKYWEEVKHVVIIPEYKEPIHILRRTLSNLASQKFPKEKLIVVLATEAKDPDADTTAGILQKEYTSIFGKFIVTKHILSVGETAGKSSNMAWAAKETVNLLTKDNPINKYVTITSCDADAILHPSYFAYLSTKFLEDPDREFHFYQGAILFYTNIWRIPLPNKIYNTINSIGNLSVLSQGKRFINFGDYPFLDWGVKHGQNIQVFILQQGYACRDRPHVREERRHNAEVLHKQVPQKHARAQKDSAPPQVVQV